MAMRIGWRVAVLGALLNFAEVVCQTPTDDAPPTDDQQSFPASHTNDNQHLTTTGMVETICINVFVFICLTLIFESNRFYKQIYLKRLQNRFRIADRVPPNPPENTFGWYFEMNKISETEILRMVGLDAYMCLRFIVVCYKLALFLTFWGLVVLIPVYSTATPDGEWDRLAINNLLNGPKSNRRRLWVAAFFGYIFAAYFCQLLYMEYNNFSVRRLQYLVQSDPDGENLDPDTPPQKYFTVMIERIPPHLRSAQALRKFFDKIFPGEVFTVEVALDIAELDAMNAKRKRLRAKLEHAIAYYEATNERMGCYAARNKEYLYSGDSDGIFGEDSLWDFFTKQLRPEKFGYEPVDALHYYTHKLIRYNNEVKKLQAKYDNEAKNADEGLQKRFVNKSDTRVAAIFEGIGGVAAGVSNIPSPLMGSGKKEKSKKGGFAIESLIFGGGALSIDAALDRETAKLEAIVQHEARDAQRRQSHASDPAEEAPSTSNKPPLPPKRKSATLPRPSYVQAPRPSLSVMTTESVPEPPPPPPPAALDEGIRSMDSSHHSAVGIAAAPVATSMLEQDTALKQWIADSGVDYSAEETAQASRKSFATSQYPFSAAPTPVEGDRRKSRRGSSIHHPGSTNSSRESSAHGPTYPYPYPNPSSGAPSPLAHLFNNEQTVEEMLLADDVEAAVNPIHEQRHDIKEEVHHRTTTGGVSTVLPIGALTNEQLNELTQLSIAKARVVTKQGWLQTRMAGAGAWYSLKELERAIEMVMLGAYYKYSSTAFVTFNSRITESIAQQMLLSHDAMEINHAPNPHDIIWDNVAIPKSQILMRKYITDIGVIIGSIFWSSLQLMSAVVMLVFLLILPFIFDYLARNYEGMKLESEVQNSIMTRYFYYQLINVYVTVGFSGTNIWEQLLSILRKPQTLVDILGGRMPEMSKFFFNLLIVKIFTAVPLEMIRPWQLSTVHLMGNCMDRRHATRRDLRTGAFYSWPMLYGWIYPQLMMVLMIMVTYSVITPILMPVCAFFFAGAYTMYKYQLLYVYINEYQSGGFMWYAVFNRSVIALVFASCTLLGYLSMQLNESDMAGPFFFLLPLPFILFYFMKFCDGKFKKASMNLSYGFARELDHRNTERKVAGKTTPHDTFREACYRQPSLTEGDVLPEPYRNDGNYDILQSRETGEKVVMADWNRANRKGSISINVHELLDEGEEDPIVLQDYFDAVVLPLSKVPAVESSQHSVEDDLPLLETRGRR